MRLCILFILTPFFLFSQTQIGNDIDGLAAGDNAGYSVSVSSDGSTVAIGSPSYDGIEIGHVRVFENISNNWIQIGETINGDHSDDQFGKSVSISADGSILAIGGPDRAIGGYVRIYENNGDVWTQIGNDIDGEPDYINGDGFQTNLSFGVSVSISKDGTILTIAEGRGGNGWEAGYGNPGYIHIYQNISGTWTQIGAINSGISFVNDISISDDGSIVAISGIGNFATCNFISWVGYVKVYKNESGVWTQLGSTFSGDCWVNPISGVSLSNNGSKIAIAGRYNTRVYENIDEEWVQQGNSIEAENTYEFMEKIDISNDGLTVAISGFDNSSSETRFGFVRIYKYSAGIWTKELDDINGEGLEDFFHTMKLSSNGEIIAIGSARNDGNGIDAGHVRVYDLGAVLSTNDYALSQFKIYPNPAQHEVTIQIGNNQELKQANIYSNLGQFIQTSQKNTINTSNLASGLYFVEVITNNGKATKKLIIK